MPSSKKPHSANDVKYRLLPSTPHDLRVLQLNLRPSDRSEIAYSQKVTHSNIFAQLYERVHFDNYFTLWRGNDVVAIGGITPSNWSPHVGVIWLLGTDLADRYWRQMTRICARFIDSSKCEWLGFGNVLPPDATKRIKWLEYLGFDIAPDKAHISGQEFVAFYMDTSEYGPEDR
ncbi:MAG: hypothetical protein ACPG4J_03660 [Lentibacter algarum]